MHSSHPIHRALVTFSNSTTGEIRVKIPALLGADSEVAISYIGRKAPWVVPTVGDQIVVTSDDTNLTNVFWMTTSATTNGTNGTNGDWSTAQTLATPTSSSYTISSSDAGKLLAYQPSSGTGTITVNTSHGFTQGQKVDIILLTGTACTFVASGVSIVSSNGLKLRTTYSACTLQYIASNVFVLIGDLKV